MRGGIEDRGRKGREDRRKRGSISWNKKKPGLQQDGEAERML